VNKKIDVEGMGVGVVTKFAESVAFGASLHHVQFGSGKTKRIKKLKLLRNNNGGVKFKLHTDDPFGDMGGGSGFGEGEGKGFSVEDMLGTESTDDGIGGGGGPGFVSGENYDRIHSHQSMRADTTNTQN
jgi:hypothetical protein